MDFIIDTEGDQGLLEKDNLSEQSTEFGEDGKQSDAFNLLDAKLTELLNIEKKEKEAARKANAAFAFDQAIDEFYSDMSWPAQVGFASRYKKRSRRKSKFYFENLDLETGQLTSRLAKVDVAAEMKASVLKPGMEKEHFIPEYNKSERRLKADRKIEREKTKGPGWFNMPATEVTEEIKNDLEVLKMRSVLDPKHFYKKNDMEVLPKYFQIGTVMDSPLDHINERLTKKDRKRTMVDELLADAEFSRYNKKKYKEIIDTKRKGNYRMRVRDKRAADKIEKKKNKAEGKVTKKKSSFKKGGNKRS